MTFEEYNRIKTTMEHVIVVLNVGKEYEKADEVDDLLFAMLLDYDKMPAKTYKTKFKKYYEKAMSCDAYEMKGFTL